MAGNSRAAGFWKSLSEKTKAFILAALIALLNVAFVLIFGLRGTRVEEGDVSALQFWISLGIYAAQIGLCVFLRIKRVTTVSLGIFIYQLFGVIAYLLFFAGYIGGQGADNGLTAFFEMFRWWTLGYQWFMVRVSWTTGIPFRFTSAILYMFLVYASVNSYNAAVRDIRYERQRAEDQAYIEATKGRGGMY